jgi:hypothetical protein
VQDIDNLVVSRRRERVKDERAIFVRRLSGV